MVIQARLSKNQLRRLALVRHLQRPTFYFYAAVCAAFTAYALLRGPALLLLAAWIPFVLYIGFGILQASRASAMPDHPALVATRYEFTPQGVVIRTPQAQSQLTWDQVASWRKLVSCYVLVLAGGQLIAIPESAIPSGQAPAFEALLRGHVGARPGSGG